jgi:uncharacterized protein (TIGR03435 family)
MVPSRWATLPRRVSVVRSFLILTAAFTLSAQTPDSSFGAGKHLEFDVASVKPNHTNDPSHSLFPLGPGDVYVPNGGLFNATGYNLFGYIVFAYKLQANQIQFLRPRMPEWALNERFDIQARAAGNPSKDEMRLMMQSLLADRFKLSLHRETREVPVFDVVLIRPGKTGPQLQPHSAAAPCPTNVAPQAESVPGQSASFGEMVAGGFPALCGGFQNLPPSAPDRRKIGARNVTIPFILASISGDGSRQRPMFDRTGLTGTFDFTLEWSMPGSLATDPNAQPEFSGPSFEDALRTQLGLRLESQKAPVGTLVLDHVEHPSEN